MDYRPCNWGRDDIIKMCWGGGSEVRVERLFIKPNPTRTMEAAGVWEHGEGTGGKHLRKSSNHFRSPVENKAPRRSFHFWYSTAYSLKLGRQRNLGLPGFEWERRTKTGAVFMFM